MGNHINDTFRPLPAQRADELEYVIDQSGDGKTAMVIDPDTGVVGAQPANVIAPSESARGIVRYGRHYAHASPRSPAGR